MPWNKKIHWQIFNITARVVGGGFILVGVVFSLWGLSLLLDSQATIGVNGVPATDPWNKAIILVVGLVLFVLGLSLVLARPFRPDLADSALADSKRPASDKVEKHDPAT